ncbi:hypothetical protein ACGFNU_06560 [Spirillospora sp. NPDC048911]|uniref:hypothetical protein n=1 Tax=Spirillospora sp. NPDC048911 TaxID=3364527 RepID=UPI00371E2ACC
MNDRAAGGLVFAPARVEFLEPGMYDVIRTGDFQPVVLAPAVRFYGYGLAPEGGESKIIKTPMSRAAFDEAVARTREKAGRKISGSLTWNVRYDQTGQVVEAARKPQDL